MQLRATRELPVEAEAIDRPHRDDVEEALERLALRDWVWSALEDLSDDLQATVILRYFTSRASYAEIAAILGIPVGTVRSRLNQSKRRLAKALLETTSAIHRDHGALLEERKAWWTAAADQILRHGEATLYAQNCLPDVCVEAPSLGYHEHGIDDHQRDVERSGAAGVQLHLTELLASTDVTIIDGTYQNPADDPRHCPPTHTEVRIHPADRTSRLILYFGPADQLPPARPPQPSRSPIGDNTRTVPAQHPPGPRGVPSCIG